MRIDFDHASTRAISIFILATLMGCVEPITLTRPDGSDTWTVSGHWEPSGASGDLSVRHSTARSTARIHALHVPMDDDHVQAWIMATVESAWPTATLRSVEETKTEALNARAYTFATDGKDGVYEHTFVPLGSDRVLEIVTHESELEDTTEDRATLLSGFARGADQVTRSSGGGAMLGALERAGVGVDLSKVDPSIAGRIATGEIDGGARVLVNGSLIEGSVIRYALPYPTTRADLLDVLGASASRDGSTLRPLEGERIALLSEEKSALSPMLHFHGLSVDGVDVVHVTLSTPASLEAVNLPHILSLFDALERIER